MKKVLSRPAFWLGLGILALLVVIWFIGDSLNLQGDEITRLLIPVAVVLYGGLLIYVVRDHLAGRRLAKDMSDDARRRAAQQGAEAVRDFKELEQDFNQAFAQLAEICKDRGLLRGDGATGLPWIVIIGPPGTGKTTALENSGLRFTSLGRHLAGIGGTRNCTWWLTEDAVFLDTAGRYSVQDENRDEWLTFLGMLRKRRRQPIDSALVQIGMDELLHLSAREQTAVAQRLRERLDELTKHLGVRFPVHLVFNKCDLLDGFSEFFAALPQEERARPLGFGIDLEATPRRPTTEVFSTRFDELCDRLMGRATRYMYLQGATGAQAREAILYFPLELRRHRDALARFTEELFTDQGSVERPLLMGVYLTSAAQGSEALSGARHELVTQLGLGTHRPGARRALSQEPNPYFLRGLFERVITQAQNAARPNSEQQRRMRTRQRMSVAVGMLSCFAGMWLLGWRYRADEQWLREVKNATHRLRAGKDLSNPDGVKLADLSSELVEQVALLELLDQRQEGGRLAAAHKAARKLLHDRIDDQLLRPLRPVMERHIAAGASWAEDGPGEIFARSYRALQADFLLRRGECQSTTLRARHGLLTDYAETLWWDELGERGKGADAEEIRGRLRVVLADYFARYLRDDKTQSELLGEARVSDARDRLRQGSSRLNPMLIFNLMASGAGLYKTDKQIRGQVFADGGVQLAYTQEGCRRFFDQKTSQGQEWWSCVLGLPLERKIDLESPEMQQYYSEQYQHAWTGWLNTLNLRRDSKAKNPKAVLEDMGALLSRLARGEDSELEQLLRTVGKGSALLSRPPVDLGGADSGLINGCMSRWRKSETARMVDTATAPRACRQGEAAFAAYDQALRADKKTDLSDSYVAYAKALRTLDKKLQHLRRSADGGLDALAIVLDTTKNSGELQDTAGKRRDLMYNLKNHSTQHPVDPAGMDRVLESLEREIWRAVLTMATPALNSQWRDQVYNQWREHHQRAQGDAGYCPTLLDYVKQKVEPYASKAVLPFFREGSCEPKAPADPFDDLGMNFDRDVCVKVRAVTALALFRCPDAPAGGGPPPAPLPPREPLAADYERPQNCEEVKSVQLDNGARVFECNTAVRRCVATEVETTGRVSLKMLVGSSWRQIGKADTMDDLLRGRYVPGNDNRALFDLTGSKVGGVCPGIRVFLEFRPRPRLPEGPRGPAPDLRWRTLDLPPDLVLPIKQRSEK